MCQAPCGCFAATVLILQLRKLRFHKIKGLCAVKGQGFKTPGFPSCGDLFPMPPDHNRPWWARTVASRVHKFLTLPSFSLLPQPQVYHFTNKDTEAERWPVSGSLPQSA